MHPRLADVLCAARPQDAATWLRAARDPEGTPQGAPSRSVTRAEVAGLADAWRPAVEPGARVALLAPDPLDFARLFVCLVAVGAVVVPLDPGAPAQDRDDLVQRSGAGVVLATEPAPDSHSGVPVVEVGAGLRPGRTHCGATDRGATDRGATDRGATDRGATDRGATDRGATDPPAEGGVLLFSSGSTGPRKAVLLGERQLLHVARAVADHHRLTAQDVGYNPLPLFHVNAEVVALLASLLSGGCLVLDDRFHRTGFAALLHRFGVTWVNAVPAIISILAAEPSHAGALPATVRFVRSASAPLPAPVLERFEHRYAVPVLETYGMTEAASQITANPLDGPRKPGSVGLPVAVELRLVGDRVQIRGPGVITRYADGAGADRFDPQGWLDTGDVGRLDEDGYLYLAGRTGDVINRGGEKVFPREIEDVLRRHPRVKEAVVVARDDDVLGQVPVAFVVPHGAGEVDGLLSELAELTRAKLARYRRPAQVHVVDELPLGPTGKIQRARLQNGWAAR